MHSGGDGAVVGGGWPHTGNRRKAAVEETQQDFRRSCSLRKSQDVKAKGYRFKEEAEQIGMRIPSPRVGRCLVRRETSLEIKSVGKLWYPEKKLLL